MQLRHRQVYGINPRVLELAEEFNKPLPIIYQQPWLTGEVPGELGNVTLIYKKGQKEVPGNYRSDLTSVLWKVTEQITLNAFVQCVQDEQNQAQPAGVSKMQVLPDQPRFFL